MMKTRSIEIEHDFRNDTYDLVVANGNKTETRITLTSKELINLDIQISVQLHARFLHEKKELA